MPRFIKPQGNLLNSHYYIGTNLFSCYVGERVLRTKLCQGGGYDEDIQSTITHGAKPKMINQAEHGRKHQLNVMHIYKAWDPGDGVLIHKAEDSRFEDMKTHALMRTSKLETSKSHHQMTRSISKKNQAAFNTFVEKASQLHSFSLQPGFIPLGFTGEVFNEIVASPNGQAPPGDKPFNHHNQAIEEKAEKKLFGPNRLLSLFVIEARVKSATRGDSRPRRGFKTHVGRSSRSNGGFKDTQIRMKI